MNKPKVLIVENEVIVAMDLKNTLIKLEFIVTDIVSNPNNVLISIDNNKPDIILMDINLGNGKDGIEIVKDINSIKHIPIIYLTGFNNDEIMNRAIKTNPVGYLIKPYKYLELKAGILLGLYKKNNKDYEDYKNLGFNYYFDNINKNLYYQGNIIKLGKKEIIFLTVLIQANGKIVSFETIENKLSYDYPVSSDSIRMLVYRLRNKMNYKFIESIPYFGFRL